MLSSICKRVLFPASYRSCQRCLCSTAAKASNPVDNESIPEQTDSKAPLGDEVSALKSEVETLKTTHAKEVEKCKALDDKYRRAIAENENQRVRLNKKIEEAKTFGIQKFSKDLLGISDTLALALNSVSEDQLNSHEPLRDLFNGLKMTEVQLQKVFSNHSLLKIDPIDQPFNPHEHEAVFYQPVEGKESGTIINVQKVGYKLHDRVIRPAIVGVAK
ncbi:grpE protein homolog 1, mitochondrial-like [Convolutriloba macropyga]|uniref:grpE protein homolog 1, mitochondrial-like n=1 Tax=Convolutriloba macropyga TaxID=536237 RepID=UPI003F528147